MIPHELATTIFTILTVIGFGVTIVLGLNIFDKNIKYKTRMAYIFSIVLLLLIWGLLVNWIKSVNYPFEPYKIAYTPIIKNGDVKYYIYENKVYNIENYVDDKNFKIKLLFLKDRVENGLCLRPNSYTIVQYVPVIEKETTEPIK